MDGPYPRGYRESDKLWRQSSCFNSSWCLPVKGRSWICSSITSFSLNWSLSNVIGTASVLADCYPSLPHSISSGAVLCQGVPEGHPLIGCSRVILSHLCTCLYEFVMIGTKSLTSHWLRASFWQELLRGKRHFQLKWHSCAYNGKCFSNYIVIKSKHTHEYQFSSVVCQIPENDGVGAGKQTQVKK